jgi:hypothetical protein
MPAAPAVSCAMIAVERTRVTTSTPESPGIPARNGFNGFLRALPGDRALLPPSPGGYVLSKPGRADATPPNLTPASGRQDHTTSPSALASFVSSPFDRSRAETRPASRCAPNAAASTASAPRVRDDRDTPLCGVGRLESIKLFLPNGEAKYFCWRYWTGFSSARPSGKSLARCSLQRAIIIQPAWSCAHIRNSRSVS